MPTLAPVADSWNFLSTHGLVLVLLTQQPDMRLRDIAAATGITERAAQNVVNHLVSTGYVERTRVGRRNRYVVRGDRLLPQEGVGGRETERLIARRLVPLATLVTPNLDEAGVLTEEEVRTPEQMERAARALLKLGARAALVKGGHLAGPALDVLYDGSEVHELSAPRLTTHPTHGAGCTLSAAITAGLARGLALAAAVAVAKRYVTRAIETAAAVGHGAVPLNHLVRPDE